jgi:hypothetical protein
VSERREALAATISIAALGVLSGAAVGGVALGWSTQTRLPWTGFGCLTPRLFLGSDATGGGKLAGTETATARRGGKTMAYHQDIGEWQGKDLVDRAGEKIGKLEDVYVDVETNEPMFGTVKEGLIGRHLTFVPLAGITIGPDNLQVTVAREQVKTAPNIELHGDELSPEDESTLYHHYQLNYTPPDTERGRRLARR